MKDETRKDVPAAEPEQETKRIPQPEETQYDLEEILEEALEEQYTPPTQENGETPEPEADQAAGQGEDAPEPEETAEGEPEAISVPEADAEGEQEETERFIQEQVTSALGDTYSEETLRKQEERAAQMRKVRATKRRSRRKRAERCGEKRRWKPPSGIGSAPSSPSRKSHRRRESRTTSSRCLSPSSSPSEM